MLRTFYVDYLDGGELLFTFKCLAEDSEHAAEQCENAYPGCTIVAVHKG